MQKLFWIITTIIHYICRGRRPRRPEITQTNAITLNFTPVGDGVLDAPKTIPTDKCQFAPVGDGVLFCPETYQQIFIKSRVGELCFTSVGQGLAPAVPQQFIKDKLKLNHQI